MNPMLTPAAREALLDDEFIRAPLPGIREISAGVLKIFRKLRLSFALPTAERQDLSAEEDALEMIAATWILDERHPLLDVRVAADLGRAEFFHRHVGPYEFEVSPALVTLAQIQIGRTNAAVEAAMVHVHPKPGAGGGDTPPGNS